MAKSNNRSSSCRSKASNDASTSGRAKPVVMKAGMTRNPRRRYEDGGKLK